VGLNHFIGRVEGHKGRHLQNPRGGQVLQFEVVEL
jgi:hypothetical protein